MDLAEFYDNIVLRDVLEYSAPGAVVIFGLSLIQESIDARLGMGISVLSLTKGNPWLVFVVSLILSYVMGHILTAIHAWRFRGNERQVASQLLQESKHGWLKMKIAEVISHQLRMSQDEALKRLDVAESAEIIREIGRSIVQSQAANLYREFVGRHSILSRFCQNMAIAIVFFLASFLAAAVVSWTKLVTMAHGCPLTVCIIIGVVLAAGALSSLALFHRSSRLRKSMIRHTFEIWLVAYFQLTQDGNSAKPLQSAAAP